MGLFKTFKAPKAAISISTAKDSFVLGETITGNLLVTPEEELEAEEVRVELEAVERVRYLKTSPEDVIETLPQNDNETRETRIYTTSPDDPEFENGSFTFLMYQGTTKVSGKLRVTKGSSQQFPFKITVPFGLGPTFRGPRRDGIWWIERAWTLKGIVAAKGRPDVQGRKDVQITLGAAPSHTAPTPPAGTPTLSEGPGEVRIQ